MESSHKPRTYSHLSELSVALSHSDLVENVPAMNTKISDDPPDGGYGWCIVLAIGFCNFVIIHSRICSSRNSLNALEDRRQICHWLPLLMPLYAVSAVSINSFYPFSVVTWFLSLPYFCACDFLPCAHI